LEGSTRLAVAPVLTARPESAVIFEFTWEAAEEAHGREGLGLAEEFVRWAASAGLSAAR
jgi:hypothetical protein